MTRLWPLSPLGLSLVLAEHLLVPGVSLLPSFVFTAAFEGPPSGQVLWEVGTVLSLWTGKQNPSV